MNRQYSIALTKNFRKAYRYESTRTLFKRYSDLMGQLLYSALDSPTLIGSRSKTFIIRRGAETVKHCFKIIFMYTKDIDITFYHCKKAYCYYIEFMGQISDNSHSYLQLNSKDAALFVYKKTLFEMNSDFKKTFTLDLAETEYLELVSGLIEVYHEMLLFLFLGTANQKGWGNESAHFALEKSDLIIGKILKAKCTIADKVHLTNLLSLFGAVMRNHLPSPAEYCGLCETFANKIRRKKLSYGALEAKLYNSECKKTLTSHTHLRFVNWLYIH